MRALALAAFLVLFAPGGFAAREPKPIPSDPRDVPNESILARTESESDIDGNRVKEGLILVNVLTGATAPGAASEVILGVIGPARGKERGPLLWVRHVAKDTGKPAHGGEISAVDLDGDGASELVLTWDRSLQDGVRDRFCEIWVADGPDRLRKVWEGPWEVDTRRDDKRPVSERQRFETAIDFGATRALAGKGVVLTRTHTVIAGETLAAPRVVREELALRLRS